ncbi:alpha-L-rhamnosidase [Rhodococcus sp. OK302]|uniref:alpha-L-rhamnosidase n=1 Tax=Rhodococcus sp. OK302 TaxID=1882769 RepID=UPI00159516D9|nr:alpha-L-rhamnosidase [Rhodococcus sp. OK302]
MTLERLKAAHRNRPLGIAGETLFLRWSLSDTDRLDSYATFAVHLDCSETNLGPSSLWRINGLSHPWVEYNGPTLKPCTRYYWQVTATTSGGQRITSAVEHFETGITDADQWVGPWISTPLLDYRSEAWDPVPQLRKEFQLDATPTDGRIYATALGLYRIWINGDELTVNSHFRPGWTDYHVRVNHQTFDCSAHLVKGTNTIAVALAKGWYAGRIGLVRDPGLYGTQPAFRMQARIHAPDGLEQLVVSDSTWRYSYGPIQASDMLRGEFKDLRRETPGWETSNFDDSQWNSVLPRADISVPIFPQPHDSIATRSVIEGSLVHEHARGPAVFDFGQNLVGWTRIDSPTTPGTDIIVRHGEILTKDKLVYRDNLRGAFQEDRYATGTEEPQILEPDFTLHGFRYAEVWGLPPKDFAMAFELRENSTISAVSIETPHDQVGHFSCSDERLNKLASAIEWTIRGNFLEVPTDCPQRDERLGWLGDAGVIAETAAYNFDVAAFFTKFAQDCADAQFEDGSVPSYAPVVPPATMKEGSPGWSDGYIRIVHLLMARYGDITPARNHFESMCRYLGHIDQHNPDGLRVNAVGSNFGDWLSVPDGQEGTIHPGYTYTGAHSTSPVDVVATAHTYRSFVQVAEIAHKLGYEEESVRLGNRAEQIRTAYRAAYVLPDGRILGDTQTVYAQAIGYSLLHDFEINRAVEHLTRAVNRSGHVTTGIHGVEHLLPVLADNGQRALAYELLLSEKCPSWLHMIASGGTTIWEKWNGIGEDGGLETAEMNSFNHYALGAVGRFLYEGIAGIRLQNSSWTGEFGFSPKYSTSLSWARARYESPIGAISSHWCWDGPSILHDVEVPPAARATFALTDGDRVVRIDGSTIEPAGTVNLGPGHHQLLVLPGTKD